MEMRWMAGMKVSGSPFERFLFLLSNTMFRDERTKCTPSRTVLGRMIHRIFSHWLFFICSFILDGARSIERSGIYYIDSFFLRICSRSIFSLIFQWSSHSTSRPKVTLLMTWVVLPLYKALSGALISLPVPFCRKCMRSWLKLYLRVVVLRWDLDH
jgi:hypothetical protein